LNSSKPGIGGNAEAGKRSMEVPPDNSNGLNYCYSTTEETPLPNKYEPLIKSNDTKADP
jgi:hypothetical protein